MRGARPIEAAATSRAGGSVARYETVENEHALDLALLRREPGLVPGSRGPTASIQWSSGALGIKGKLTRQHLAAEVGDEHVLVVDGMPYRVPGSLLPDEHARRRPSVSPSASPGEYLVGTAFRGRM